eukprot:snap_masked-scaffold_41-processed-gene-0.17-mRNA-1 protein AED:1.00 eAED:1.00 QI:0/-1/0/0/-1/1/1/0/342
MNKRASFTSRISCFKPGCPSAVFPQARYCADHLPRVDKIQWVRLSKKLVVEETASSLDLALNLSRIGHTDHTHQAQNIIQNSSVSKDSSGNKLLKKQFDPPLFCLPPNSSRLNTGATLPLSSEIKVFPEQMFELAQNAFLKHQGEAFIRENKLDVRLKSPYLTRKRKISDGKEVLSSLDIIDLSHCLRNICAKKIKSEMNLFLRSFGWDKSLALSHLKTLYEKLFVLNLKCSIADLYTFVASSPSKYKDDSIKTFLTTLEGIETGSLRSQFETSDGIRVKLEIHNYGLLKHLISKPSCMIKLEDDRFIFIRLPFNIYYKEVGEVQGVELHWGIAMTMEKMRF